MLIYFRDTTLADTVIAPALKVRFIRIFRRSFLIDIDAESRLIVGVHIAFANLRRAVEDFACLVIEERLF